MLMELLVSYLYQVQLQTHAALLLELFLLDGLNARNNHTSWLWRMTSLPS